MDRQFHPTLYNGCNYLSMAGLKLIHVCKRSHRSIRYLISSYWRHMATGIWINIGLDNGLLSGDNKPLYRTMLNNNQWSLVAVDIELVHWQFSSFLSLICLWKLLVLNYRISLEPVNWDLWHVWTCLAGFTVSHKTLLYTRSYMFQTLAKYMLIKVFDNVFKMK